MDRRSTRRLAADVDALAQIGREGGGVTRLAWSPELAEASRWLTQRLEAEGLEVAVDAAGNVLGKWVVGDGRLAARCSGVVRSPARI